MLSTLEELSKTNGSVINICMQTDQISAIIGQAPIPIAVKVKYVLYARKSTEQDEKQALSIESQVKEKRIPLRTQDKDQSSKRY